MSRIIKVLFLAAVLAVPVVMPSPAEAHAGTCTKNGHGNTYALNAEVNAAPAAKTWSVVAAEWEYLSSDPQDVGIERKNNVKIQLVAGGTAQWSYISPDNQPYALPQTTTINKVVNREGNPILRFTAAFDHRDAPDVGCTATVYLNGAQGICVTCPVDAIVP